MQRNPSVAGNRISAGTTAENFPAKPTVISRPQPEQLGTFWDMLGFRFLFTIVCTLVGYHFRPFSVTGEYGALGGFLFAMAVILFEVRLRKASLRRSDWRGHRLDTRDSGRLPHLPDFHAYDDAGEHPFVLQPRRISGDDLHGPGVWARARATC